jgi:hypothetical protein
MQQNSFELLIKALKQGKGRTSKTENYELRTHQSFETRLEMGVI